MVVRFLFVLFSNSSLSWTVSCSRSVSLSTRSSFSLISWLSILLNVVAFYIWYILSVSDSCKSILFAFLSHICYFHQISCHQSYLSNLFHHIICQYYLYHFWNSILPISKLIYHQLIFLHHFHLFIYLSCCVIFSSYVVFSTFLYLSSSLSFWALSSSDVKFTSLSFSILSIFSHIWWFKYC